MNQILSEIHINCELILYSISKQKGRTDTLSSLLEQKKFNNKYFLFDFQRHNRKLKENISKIKFHIWNMTKLKI